MVRHAETTWNAAGRVQGQADPPLSELGRRQCELLQDRMRGVSVDALFTSDLARARETAGAIADRTNVTAVLEPGLREVGLGAWEGFDRARLEREYPELAAEWAREPSWDIVPGGEGATAFRARVLGTMQRLVDGRGASETVAVVTHIGVIRMVLSVAAGLESRGLRWPWAVDNTAITSLVGPPDVSAWNTPAMAVWAVNDASHLDPGLAA